MSCPHGRTGMCAECSKQIKAQRARLIREGKGAWGVFQWNAQALYPASNALKTYKQRPAAEREAERLGSVGYCVRFVHFSIDAER